MTDYVKSINDPIGVTDLGSPQVTLYGATALDPVGMSDRAVGVIHTDFNEVTMASVLTNYYGNLMLFETLYKNGGWLALHEADPGVTGDITTELGGSTRQSQVYASPSGKALVSSNAQLFTDLPAAVIPFLAIWDLQVGGHALVTLDLVSLGYSPIVTTASGQILFAPGDIAIQL